MATNKRELAQEIDSLLAQGGQAKNMEEATRLRQRLAEALADKIDTYVQYQIGIRLEGILSAVGVPSASDANVTPLVQGPGFSSLIRKS